MSTGPAHWCQSNHQAVIKNKHKIENIFTSKLGPTWNTESQVKCLATDLFIPSVFRVCWKCSAYCWPLTRGGEGEGGGGCIGIQRLSCYFRIISRNFPFTDGKPKERMFFLTPSLPVAGLELLLFTSTEVVTPSYANTRNIWSWLLTTDYCRDCCVLLNDSNRRE